MIYAMKRRVIICGGFLTRVVNHYERIWQNWRVVHAEEIAINRNSSEGLETIIFGLQLKAGDEVVAAKQDYPNMINAYKQREMRDGIKMVWINLELPSEDENYLVQQYVKAFTPKTKLVHITHIINWNGQILPVRKIARRST